jgi:CubicO group peptidase (beta-lactamase class C family)
LIHEPGERWLYNSGSDILGVLIARASGQPFEAFLRERIFEPLDMKDTTFYVPAEKIDRLATAYAPNMQTGALEIYDRAEGGEWSRPPAFASGAGGLVSTADDYLAFAWMLLNNGKWGNIRVLSAASVELMTQDHLTAAQKADAGLIPGFFDMHGWGFGVSVVTRPSGLEPLGAYGWNGGLGTSWASDPATDFTAILMTQRAFTSPRPPDVHRDFWTLAYQTLAD